MVRGRNRKNEAEAAAAALKLEAEAEAAAPEPEPEDGAEAAAAALKPEAKGTQAEAAAADATAQGRANPPQQDQSFVDDGASDFLSDSAPAAAAAAAAATATETKANDAESTQETDATVVETNAEKRSEDPQNDAKGSRGGRVDEKKTKATPATSRKGTLQSGYNYKHTLINLNKNEETPLLVTTSTNMKFLCQGFAREQMIDNLFIGLFGAWRYNQLIQIAADSSKVENVLKNFTDLLHEEVRRIMLDKSNLKRAFSRLSELNVINKGLLLHEFEKALSELVEAAARVGAPAGIGAPLNGSEADTGDGE
jgi:hypothetical protein